MSTAPYSQDGNLEQGADRLADAMKAQLRKDVSIVVQGAQRGIPAAGCRTDRATGQAAVTSVGCETQEVQARGRRGQTGTPWYEAVQDVL